MTTLGILWVLAEGAVSFFADVPLSAFLFDTQWTPLFADKHFGIWPLVAGTVLCSAVAAAVAVPFGLLAAIYLSEFAPANVRPLLKPALEILAGVPTIVYGYFALVVVTPVLQQWVPDLAGFNALSPGLVMGIMVVPTVASLGEDALAAVPQQLREGALGLGASPLATLLRVTLPAARSGLAAAITLALGRVVGETMIVVVAAGQQPRLTLDPRVPVETMTAYIVQVCLGDTPRGTLEYQTLFAVGATLFVFTLALNLVGQRLIRGGGLRR